MEKLKSVPARIRGIHHYSFRSGEWAEIIGVRVDTPEGLDARPAFLCRYEDGAFDHIPIIDSYNYEIEGVAVPITILA